MDEARVKRVTRIDSIPAANTSIDAQGFLHDTPVVTSTGIFEYALPDGKVRRELRLPEHVFDRDSLASYSGKPVIITHEAGSIDKSNVMDEIVGTILSDGYQDGNNVRCRIVIHDIDKVKRIPFRELSLGYSLDLIEEPGEWIDVIRFRDWLKAEMQANVFGALKANRKVPYTDSGIGLIEGKMEETLKKGQDIGGIAATEYDGDGNAVPGFQVTVPRTSDLTEEERKSRKLKGCRYTARLAGAIHAVEIEGFLTF